MPGGQERTDCVDDEERAINPEQKNGWKTFRVVAEYMALPQLWGSEGQV